MPTTTRTVFLTDENGNALIDAQGNMRALSFSLVQGYSYRLVERASIVSATYAQVVGYSTATGQTITGVENASEFDVGDFGIVQYAISDRNNTIGYVTCEVTAVGTDSLTVNGIGISVAGADGATFTPSVDTNGNLSWTNDGGLPNPETVNVRGAQGEAATVQVGTTTTLPAGSQATVANSGTNQSAVLNFGIPTGQPGADGQAATIQIGEVVTGAAGTNAIVENTGTENAAILKFTIPRGATGTPGTDGKNGATFTPSVDTNGDLSWSNNGNLPNPETVNLRGAQGEAATVQVGQVTTGAAGTQASVTNSGTNQAAVLDFTIPQGAEGADGLSALECGEIVEESLPPFEGMSILLTTLNRDPILNEKIELTYRDTNTGKIYGVLANFADGGEANDALALVVDFWQISGENGAGVPAGGTTGQVLKKKSGADYDTEWTYESGGGGGVEIVDLGTPTFQAASSGLQATVTLTSEQAAKLAAEPAPVVKFTLSGQGGGYQNGVYYLNKSFKMGVAVQIYTLALFLVGSTGWVINMQATSSQAMIAITPWTLPSN